jgi:hypothetical protein
MLDRILTTFDLKVTVNIQGLRSFIIMLAHEITKRTYKKRKQHFNIIK